MISVLAHLTAPKSNIGAKIHNVRSADLRRLDAATKEGEVIEH